MDWIRNNKFLAGFLAFMVVGVGVLGYLIFSTYGRYEQVAQEYNTQVEELKRLQAYKPYPDEKGLKLYTSLRSDYSKGVNDLQGKLAAFEPPVQNPPLSPIQFQEKLRKAVEDFNGRADGIGMARPEGFYLGFEQYRGALPPAEAAPLLSRELDAVNDLMDLLLKQRAEKITLIKRASLPQEPNSGSSAPAATPPPARGGKAGPAPVELVSRETIDLGFVAQPSAFRETLNQITSAKRLYVVRALQVKNQQEKGPLREDPNALAAAGGTGRPGAAPADPNSQPAVDANGVPAQALPEKGPPPLRYVVGLEKVDATLRLELVRVAPPAAVPAAK